MQAKLLVINPKTSAQEYVQNWLIDLIKQKDEINVEFYKNKIQTNNFLDLKQFDGSNVKKQEIIDVLNQFNFEGIEKTNIKVLFIENIDQASKFITNSLLKFIEEIPENTYIIFSTKNLNDVIQTITSRCETIKLKPNALSINQITNDLHQFNFNQQELEVVLDEIDKTKAMLVNNEIQKVNNLKTIFLNLKQTFKYEELKNDFKDLNDNQIELLLKLLFINAESLKIKKEISHLLRFNELQINKNGLLIILVSLFI